MVRWSRCSSVGGIVAPRCWPTTRAAATAGASDPVSAPSTTPEPGATRPPAPGLARFYRQQLDWTTCRKQFQCAQLTVPLDYRHPGGATIQLALLKVPAADPAHRIGSLVVNPGGPGAPGTDYAAQAAQVFLPPLLRSFDMVGFDPRGTGASDPVDCLSDAGARRLPRRRPDPGHAGRAGGLPRLGRRRSAAAASSAPARSPRTCRPSRRPATWTCCGPRWGSRR